MIIICTCVQDRKLWIIENEIAKEKNIIAIYEKENTKYHKFKVLLDDFSNTMLNLYNNSKVFNIEELNNPLGESGKKEKEYRLLRENKLSYLDFEKPIRNYMTYDFKINGFKVQEKVANVSSDISYGIRLKKSNSNNKQASYITGDNDFYWVHITDKKHFYIFTEKILIEKKIITNERHTKVHVTLYPCNDNIHWSDDYLYDYDDANLKEKLSDLFKIK